MDETRRDSLDVEIRDARPGENLYGLSVAELETRISLYRGEIIRLDAELAKKSADLAVADAIFGKKE